jgi:ABC-type transporter Mla subunit MlaD
MMTWNANYFKLGLFVILAFCLGAGFLIMFGAGELFKKELFAETCFDESVQGLDVGSEVKYKGVQIGTVKSITTPARVYGAQSSYVLVIFALDPAAFRHPAPRHLNRQFIMWLKKGSRCI